MKAMIISILFLLAASLYQSSSSPESNETAYHTYLNNHTEVMKEQWEKIVATAKEKANQNLNKDLRYALALVQYGLLTSTMRDKAEDLFDKYVDETENNLEILIDQNKNWGEPAALLAAVLELKMTYSPIKGMVLGPKSQNLMKHAIKISPSSPLVWKLYGNSKFFTPKTFGGDIKEAIKAYEKALSLYEANAVATKNNWYYLDTMAFLGQAYMKDARPDKAIAIYEKALKAEPEYVWVRTSLLPQAKKSNTPD